MSFTFPGRERISRSAGRPEEPRRSVLCGRSEPVRKMLEDGKGGTVGPPDDGRDAERVEPAPPALRIVLPSGHRRELAPPDRSRGAVKSVVLTDEHDPVLRPETIGECQGRKPRGEDLFSRRAAQCGSPFEPARAEVDGKRRGRRQHGHTGRPARGAREAAREPAEPLGREDRVERIDGKEKTDGWEIEERPRQQKGQRRREKQEIAPRVPPGEAHEEQQRQKPVVSVAVGFEPARAKDQIVRKAQDCGRALERTRARARLPRSRRAREVVPARDAFDKLARRRRIGRRDGAGPHLAPCDPRRERQKRAERRGRDSQRAGPGPQREHEESRSGEKREDLDRDRAAEEKPGQAKASGARRPERELRRRRRDRERGGPIHVRRAELEHRGRESRERQDDQGRRAAGAEPARESERGAEDEEARRALEELDDPFALPASQEEPQREIGVVAAPEKRLRAEGPAADGRAPTRRCRALPAGGTRGHPRTGPGRGLPTTSPGGRRPRARAIRPRAPEARLLEEGARPDARDSRRPAPGASAEAGRAPRVRRAPERGAPRPRRGGARACPPRPRPWRRPRADRRRRLPRP